METPPEVAKGVSPDVGVDGFSVGVDHHGNNSWGAEPSLSLNLSLPMTPCDLHVTKDTRKPIGGVTSCERRGKPGVAMEACKRTRIPALASSLKAGTRQHTLLSTNTTHTATSPKTHTHTALSPKTHTHTATSPKTHTHTALSPKTHTHSATSPKTHTHSALSPKTHTHSAPLLATSSPKCRTIVAVTMSGTKPVTSSPLLTLGVDPENHSSSESKMAASSDSASVGGAGRPTASQSAEGGGRSKERASPLRHPCHQGDINAIANGDKVSSKATEEKSGKRDEERPPGRSRMSRESCTMTSPDREPPVWGERGTDVGVQVRVEVCDRETNTSPLLPEPDTHTASNTLANGLPATAVHTVLTGLPSCHSNVSSNQKTGTGDKAFSPPLICVPIGQPPFQHVCQIDIELCSQSEVSNQKQQPMKRETTCGITREVPPEPQGGEKEEGEEEVQEVVWDEQGMTWEVYGACVDLQSLGGAIQSHLQRRIHTLRKSICSDSSAGRRRRKKKRKKRSRRRKNVFCCVFRPGCCRRTSVSA